MSEHKNLINIIPDSVDNALKNISNDTAHAIGQTLSDCWFLVFGGLSQLANKRKIKYANELEQFRQSLEAKISSIPVENQMEPDMQLVMPAFENAKYCLDQKILQEMFANLISASSDDRRNPFVHPIFAEILKTLTPLDAQNLMLIQQHYHLPICDILSMSSENAACTIRFCKICF